MSFILDKFFGDEVGMIYSNTELKKLVKIHEKEQLAELQTCVANIMTGALNLETKFVKDVMMPWDNVYKININDRLNFETLLEIFKKGYSRIPVFSDNSKDDIEDVEIVGILFVKELILLDPEDEIPVSSIINTFKHQILKVATDYKLNIMLNPMLEIIYHTMCGGKKNSGTVHPNTLNVSSNWLKSSIETMAKSKSE